jgi:hypothetical protein
MISHFEQDIETPNNKEPSETGEEDLSEESKNPSSPISSDGYEGGPINASDEKTTPDGIVVPTKMDLLFSFNGSLSFVVGSSGFIISTYSENWLPYFRYGCVVWIWGCTSYLIPTFLQLKARKRGGGFTTPFPWDLADCGEIICLACFIVGCILGGFVPATADDVLLLLGPINAFFVAGSFALTLNPLMQAILFVIKRQGSVYNRMTNSKLCGTGGTNGLRSQGDRALELLTAASFCTAGVFGGYGPTFPAVRIGNYFWEVGSVVCFLRSLLMWHNRRRGLAAPSISEVGQRGGGVGGGGDRARRS